MKNKIETDEFLKRFSELNEDALTAELSPDVGKIIAAVKSEVQTRRRKNRWRAAIKVIAAVIFVGILFNIMVLCNDNADVKAYERNVKKFVLSIVSTDKDPNTVSDGVNITDRDVESVQKKVPYHIPVPSWLPDGYSLNRVDMTDNLDGTYDITIVYASGSEYIDLLITNSDLFSKSELHTAGSPFTREIFEGTTIYYSVPKEEGENLVCFMVDKKGLFINIVGPIDETSLKKMIKSFK